MPLPQLTTICLNAAETVVLIVMIALLYKVNRSLKRMTAQHKAAMEFVNGMADGVNERMAEFDARIRVLEPGNR